MACTSYKLPTVMMLNDNPALYIYFFVVNYTLKNQSGILGRISLYKPSYKLGEDVTGTLDLSGATISCLQVST